MTDETKKRIQHRQSEELKEGNLSWYYISIANQTSFYGGLVIRACGPTDAWRKMHSLGLFPYGTDHSTRIYGPIPEDKMQRIPEDMRCRLLNKEEALNLGK